MSRLGLILVVVLASLVGAVGGAWLVLYWVTPAGEEGANISERQEMALTHWSVGDSVKRVQPAIHFEEAARHVTPAVVHIKTVYSSGEFSINPLDNFFSPQARSSGSGVIITPDGYIITNNHVIEEATSIEVVVDRRDRYFARVVGRDPNTDLALLKIKGRDLPFLRYGDSDRIIPGEWVLAVGNPFDLNSTVTAGIVSAMARNIGILSNRSGLQVESFIQTDAAVNPGNSGGALVNLKGELIGINSAIATSTGAYAGYSFAIPANLVRKVADDLFEFGLVQRGLLGVQITDVNAEVADQEHLDINRGVLVTRVNEGSAAEVAGIHAGDVIRQIDEHPVGSVSELQEWVARKRPGHQVKVTYRRSGTDAQVNAVLRDAEGSSALTRKQLLTEFEGARFEDLSYDELNKISLEGGVVIRHLEEGKWKSAGIKETFIITHIDKAPVDNLAALNAILEIKNGGMLVEGTYHGEKHSFFAIDW
ncbi:MAG: trypsin-like peptidase domain-containing protein [Cyclobacteriaceae bacterium]|nr:trypsin-like peptidase domain-containing protein [Cyclobacteriaceae bacterium]